MKGSDAYSGLEVDKNGAWNVVFIIGLVEEDILAVAAFRRPVFEYALLADAMFSTKLLPVHGTHLTGYSSQIRAERPGIEWNRTLVAALPQLHCNYFARHVGGTLSSVFRAVLCWK